MKISAFSLFGAAALALSLFTAVLPASAQDTDSAMSGKMSGHHMMRHHMMRHRRMHHTMRHHMMMRHHRMHHRMMRHHMNMGNM